jgi:adenosylhomocysteinase
LASGQGHPVEIMDTSFAVQALGLELMSKNHASMAKGVHEFPAELDDEIARIKLQTLGVNIDALTTEQSEYMTGWEHGT